MQLFQELKLTHQCFPFLTIEHVIHPSIHPSIISIKKPGSHSSPLPSPVVVWEQEGRRTLGGGPKLPTPVLHAKQGWQFEILGSSAKRTLAKLSKEDVTEKTKDGIAVGVVPKLGPEVLLITQSNAGGGYLR